MVLSKSAEQCLASSSASRSAVVVVDDEHARTRRILRFMRIDTLVTVELRVCQVAQIVGVLAGTPGSCMHGVLYGRLPFAKDDAGVLGTDRLQFYIRPVVQADTCWP